MPQLQPNGYLWIWKPFLPFQTAPPKDEQRVIVDDYIEHPDDRLTLISGTSVHVANDKAAGAWKIYNNGERGDKRCMLQPLEHQEHSHSYQHELETFHIVLKDAEEKPQFPH